MDLQKAVQTDGTEASLLEKKIHRRKFFKFSSVAVASAAFIASCDKDDDDDGVNLGSGDVGILNYAYALEQLEAAFYTQVVLTPYSGISTLETEYLRDIRDHEIAHREFFKAAIAGVGTPIQDLEVDFSSITFTSRTSVLDTAKAFEDLGVSAYNGAGKLLTSAVYLGLAGKIVSVEARHAAIIRDLITPGGTAFADSEVVKDMGLDVARTPPEVLEIARKFLKTKINANNLPTS